MSLPAPALPFPITVCGLEELPDHVDRRVSHVLSIIDPDKTELEVFGTYGEHERLELKFHDVIEETTEAYKAPTREDVAQILAFGRDILRDPASIRHLLVHCHMGISRSSAAMTLLLALAQPDVPARHVLGQVLSIRDKAWPNLRMLTFGEEELNRPGEFSTAVAEIYHIQMDRKPEMKELFYSFGRGREVDLGLAFKAGN